MALGCCVVFSSQGTVRSSSAACLHVPPAGLLSQEEVITVEAPAGILCLVSSIYIRDRPVIDTADNIGQYSASWGVLSSTLLFFVSIVDQIRRVGLNIHLQPVPFRLCF